MLSRARVVICLAILLVLLPVTVAATLDGAYTLQGKVYLLILRSAQCLAVAAAIYFIPIVQARRKHRAQVVESFGSLWEGHFTDKALRRRLISAVVLYGCDKNRRAFVRLVRLLREDLTSRERAVGLYFAARCAYDDQEYAVALDCLKGAVELWPGLHHAWRMLALLHRGREEPEQAERALRYAIKLHPEEGEGYLDLGIALTLWRRHDEAFEMLQLARQHGAHIGRTHLALGVVYALRGDEQTSWSHLTQGEKYCGREEAEAARQAIRELMEAPHAAAPGSLIEGDSPTAANQ